MAKDIGCYLPRVDRWSDFGRKVLAPAPDVTAELDTSTIRRIESLIGAKFNHPHILAQALVSNPSTQANRHLLSRQSA